MILGPPRKPVRPMALCLPPAGSARFGGLERALFWTWMLERACKVGPRSPGRILHDLMNTGLGEGVQGAAEAPDRPTGFRTDPLLKGSGWVDMRKQLRVPLPL